MESPKDIFGHSRVKHSFPTWAATSFPTLLSTGEATSAVLSPALGSLVQERDGASPMQGHEENEGSEASFIREEAESTGAVQPREE